MAEQAGQIAPCLEIGLKPYLDLFRHYGANGVMLITASHPPVSLQLSMVSRASLPFGKTKCSLAKKV